MTAPEREALAGRARAQAIDLRACNALPRHHRDTQDEIDAAADILDEIAALIEALSAPAVTVTGGWQPIETAPKGRKIIGGYFNELGNWRSVMARYYLPKTLDWNSDYDGGDEDGFAPEGWYEEIENSDTVYPMREPTHWQHLPAALKSTTPQTGSQE